MYPSSENKGADQLCSYCEADLRLCFCIGKNRVFSWHSSTIVHFVLKPLRQGKSTASSVNHFNEDKLNKRNLFIFPALKIVLGSMYKDDIILKPVQMIGVLAAGTLLQLVRNEPLHEKTNNMVAE